MASVGTGGSKSRFIKRAWPNEEGLTAGTQKQEGRTSNLVAEESKVLEKEEKGIR